MRALAPAYLFKCCRFCRPSSGASRACRPVSSIAKSCGSAAATCGREAFHLAKPGGHHGQRIIWPGAYSNTYAYNQTAREFAFDMVAQDVVIKDGKRTFVAAGETPNSIAATAVFTQKTVIAKPFSSISVDVRLTLPAKTDIRAVVAMFRGTDKLPSSTGAVGMTASL